MTVVSTALPRDNILQGWISDLMVGARAAVFGVESLQESPVLVIGEDKRSLDHPRLANIPRALFSPIYTELANKLFENDGEGLILDVILAFDARDLKVGDETPLKRYDVPFLKLLRAEQERGRVVLGRSAELLPARRFSQMAGERGLAMVPVSFDTSNVIRRAPTWLSLRGPEKEVYPTLSGRALSLLGIDPPEWINLMPRAPLTTLPSASLIDLLECDEPEALKQLLAGRVVFLGGMLPSEDRLRTPDQLIPRADLDPIEAAGPPAPCDFAPPVTRDARDKTLPGVFIHAAAVDAVASGWHAPLLPLILQHALTFVVAFAAAFSAFHLSMTLGGIVLAGLLALVFGASVLAFQAGFFLPVAWSMTGVPISLALGYGVRVRLVDRKSNLIRREFSRYLSPVLVERMIDQDEMPNLDGEQRDVTIMFADLTGFTAVSEEIDSATLVPILNRYLNAISDVVQQHGGYVDKFIGDAVMAIFNAPLNVEDHAYQAVSAAHEVERRISEMAKRHTASGHPSFRIKIGISTGTSTVGNVGSKDRVNYTVVGANVNLAARFEGLPSVLRTPIVIGPVAAARVEGRFTLLRLATVRVRGKRRSVDAFAPFDPAEVNATVLERCAEYADALELFEAGDFEASATAWERLAEMPWPGAGPARSMAKHSRRLTSYKLHKPWDGVLETWSK